MAEIIRSPLSGGIRAVRNTVPSSLFRTSETDPVFGRWLQNNNGIGNALAARNSTLLEGIQAQLNGVSNQAVVLSNALQVIASNIATEVCEKPPPLIIRPDAVFFDFCIQSTISPSELD